MSLYVRVLTNFYAHRKTLRLRAAIGDAAFWVPPRLWAYAAENQPDGCFKDFTNDEIAMLIGYSGNAQALLEALLKSGFMDAKPLRIHDWDEHNSYHNTFSIRAKKAADVRWAEERKRKEKTVPDQTVPDQKGASIASSIKPSMEAMRLQGQKIGLPDSESEACFHFYESNGWRVGRNPMKSWPSAMQNWKKNYDQRRFSTAGSGGGSSRPRPLTGAEQRQVGIPEIKRTLTATEIIERQAQQQQQRDRDAAAAQRVAAAPSGS